ncbi:PIN domain-containing protein [Roseobacter sp. HKCCD9010]|uniref:type II toxin-antitoxin system VapC family toxin n=1 Tax=unclassified Roseobacter TaxID=196798 RepID=UPI001492B23B|nr:MULTISPECIES: type II toxin-antitoxin system VapC family toxin [unclassified Roseobacter]MBF9052592.1 PIN domain-containing protein [Rhodobacterales bacterium HKCCD4356]NNV14534.1 PIN domain-containing protein [Roseobacter sp. HKCCD7357]NNV18787.1 PIN domain-containing protein [Roseobacter sp. HKCCD8768]NNV28252.1 PIN domain-containing protein [Roseobacter sp. HKCCD8192]NNV32521.1 PIN domain-containing protein [Roseobacter sp. HKCCD9061]
MAFLLDTNIVSETVRPKPERRVLAWIEERSPAELFLASMTIGELMCGARRIKDEPRRTTYERWIENDLSEQFEGRILPFDDKAARTWGRLMGDGDRKGLTPAAADAQIAAIAINHRLILVTRNVRDFQNFDLEIINPWDREGDD